jgi:hypothetical protein
MTTDIENRIHISASGEYVLQLAERVENWPYLLDHYRRVDVVATRPKGRIVEMAAVRPPIPVPVRWRAIQQAELEAMRVHYHHIGGVTRGMEVEWRIVPAGDGVDVTIVHRFAPPWPWPGPWVARWIVCGFFVHAIADRTLAGIKATAEGPGTRIHIVSEAPGRVAGDHVVPERPRRWRRLLGARE